MQANQEPDTTFQTRTDGSCGVVGFFMGFVMDVLAGHHDDDNESYALFLLIFHETVEIDGKKYDETFEDFKRFVDEHKGNVELLKDKLSSVFRKLIAKLIQEGERAEEKKNDLNIRLQAELNCRIEKALGLSADKGNEDITRITVFKRRIDTLTEATLKTLRSMKIEASALRRAFQEVQKNGAQASHNFLTLTATFEDLVNNQKAELSKWLYTKGFLAYMAEILQQDTWIGLTELTLLASYFHTDLIIIRPTGIPTLYWCNAKTINNQKEKWQISEEDIMELQNRGILGQRDREHPNQLEMVQMTFSEFDQRCRALPDCLSYVSTYQGAFAPVRDADDTHLQALSSRGAIVQTAKSSGDYRISYLYVEKNRCERRLVEAPFYQELAKKYEATNERCFTLQNTVGHYVIRLNRAEVAKQWDVLLQSVIETQHPSTPHTPRIFIENQSLFSPLRTPFSSQRATTPARRGMGLSSVRRRLDYPRTPISPTTPISPRPRPTPISPPRGSSPRKSPTKNKQTAQDDWRELDQKPPSLFNACRIEKELVTHEDFDRFAKTIIDATRFLLRDDIIQGPSAKDALITHHYNRICNTIRAASLPEEIKSKIYPAMQELVAACVASIQQQPNETPEKARERLKLAIPIIRASKTMLDTKYVCSESVVEWPNGASAPRGTPVKKDTPASLMSSLSNLKQLTPHQVERHIEHTPMSSPNNHGRLTSHQIEYLQALYPKKKQDTENGYLALGLPYQVEAKNPCANLPHGFAAVRGNWWRTSLTIKKFLTMEEEEPVYQTDQCAPIYHSASLPATSGQYLTPTRLYETFLCFHQDMKAYEKLPKKSEKLNVNVTSLTENTDIVREEHIALCMLAAEFKDQLTIFYANLPLKVNDQYSSLQDLRFIQFSKTALMFFKYVRNQLREISNLIPLNTKRDNSEHSFSNNVQKAITHLKTFFQEFFKFYTISVAGLIEKIQQHQNEYQELLRLCRFIALHIETGEIERLDKETIVAKLKEEIGQGIGINFKDHPNQTIDGLFEEKLKMLQGKEKRLATSLRKLLEIDSFTTASQDFLKEIFKFERNESLGNPETPEGKLKGLLRDLFVRLSAFTDLHLLQKKPKNSHKERFSIASRNIHLLHGGGLETKSCVSCDTGIHNSLSLVQLFFSELLFLEHYHYLPPYWGGMEFQTRIRPETELLYKTLDFNADAKLVRVMGSLPGLSPSVIPEGDDRISGAINANYAVTSTYEAAFSGKNLYPSPVDSWQPHVLSKTLLEVCHAQSIELSQLQVDALNLLSYDEKNLIGQIENIINESIPADKVDAINIEFLLIMVAKNRKKILQTMKITDERLTELTRINPRNKEETKGLNELEDLFIKLDMIINFKRPDLSDLTRLELLNEAKTYFAELQSLIRMDGLLSQIQLLIGLNNTLSLQQPFQAMWQDMWFEFNLYNCRQRYLHQDSFGDFAILSNVDERNTFREKSDKEAIEVLEDIKTGKFITPMRKIARRLLDRCNTAQERTHQLYKPQVSPSSGNLLTVSSLPTIFTIDGESVFDSKHKEFTIQRCESVQEAATNIQATLALALQEGIYPLSFSQTENFNEAKDSEMFRYAQRCWEVKGVTLPINKYDDSAIREPYQIFPSLEEAQKCFKFKTVPKCLTSEWIFKAIVKDLEKKKVIVKDSEQMNAIIKESERKKDKQKKDKHHTLFSQIKKLYKLLQKTDSLLNSWELLPYGDFSPIKSFRAEVAHCLLYVLKSKLGYPGSQLPEPQRIFDESPYKDFLKLHEQQSGSSKRIDTDATWKPCSHMELASRDDENFGGAVLTFLNVFNFQTLDSFAAFDRLLNQLFIEAGKNCPYNPGPNKDQSDVTDFTYTSLRCGLRRFLKSMKEASTASDDDSILVENDDAEPIGVTPQQLLCQTFRERFFCYYERTQHKAREYNMKIDFPHMHQFCRKFTLSSSLISQTLDIFDIRITTVSDKSYTEACDKHIEEKLQAENPKHFNKCVIC